MAAPSALKILHDLKGLFVPDGDMVKTMALVRLLNATPMDVPILDVSVVDNWETVARMAKRLGQFAHDMDMKLAVSAFLFVYLKRIADQPFLLKAELEKYWYYVDGYFEAHDLRDMSEACLRVDRGVLTVQAAMVAPMDAERVRNHADNVMHHLAVATLSTLDADSDPLWSVLLNRCAIMYAAVSPRDECVARFQAAVPRLSRAFGLE